MAMEWVYWQEQQSCDFHASVAPWCLLQMASNLQWSYIASMQERPYSKFEQDPTSHSRDMSQQIFVKISSFFTTPPGWFLGFTSALPQFWTVTFSRQSIPALPTQWKHPWANFFYLIWWKHNPAYGSARACDSLARFKTTRRHFSYRKITLHMVQLEPVTVQ